MRLARNNVTSGQG